MKTWILASLMLASIVGNGAEPTVVAKYDWQQLSKSGELLAGVVQSDAGRTILRVQNTNQTGLQIAILKIKSPKVSKTVYALRGEIKYQDVRGEGYLETWNFFPPLKPGLSEGQFFSRTLGVSGEMGKISGTSDWRPFILPFNRTGASGPPTRIEFNLFLPASSTVQLGPLELVEFPEGGPGAAAPGAWWSDQTAGLIGGVGGSVIGCLAGLLAWLASTGRSRTFVVRTVQVLIALGGLLGICAVTALASRQPYAVWFPLLLGSALLLGILPPRLREFRRRYEELELRKMASVDAMGG